MLCIYQDRVQPHYKPQVDAQPRFALPSASYALSCHRTDHRAKEENRQALHTLKPLRDQHPKTHRNAVDGLCLTGSEIGNIYLWKREEQIDMIVAAHKGPVYAIATFVNGFVSGGKDGKVGWIKS